MAGLQHAGSNNELRVAFVMPTKTPWSMHRTAPSFVLCWRTISVPLTARPEHTLCDVPSASTPSKPSWRRSMLPGADTTLRPPHDFVPLYSSPCANFRPRGSTCRIGPCGEHHS
eukprot:13042380-Alexandrium_andersonii.AAC.1